MAGKSKARGSRRNESQPMVESLEGRALMSSTGPVAVPTADPAGANREPQRIIGVLIALVKTKTPAPIGGVSVAVGDVNGNALMEEEGVYYY
jgi:hypothetical protein